jgi:hypothetical protein
MRGIAINGDVKEGEWGDFLVPGQEAEEDFVVVEPETTVIEWGFISLFLGLGFTLGFIVCAVFL